MEDVAGLGAADGPGEGGDEPHRHAVDGAVDDDVRHVHPDCARERDRSARAGLDTTSTCGWVSVCR